MGCEIVKRERPLKVMVQVNTSCEEQKAGCAPEECLGVVQHIVSECSNLEMTGLMTIGRFGEGAEECFEVLVKCREEVASGLGVDPLSLELSMGMSGDFEAAIALGSTNVRCGSTIFGARNYAKKQ